MAWVVILGWPLALVHFLTPNTVSAAPPGPAVFPRAIDERAAEFLRVWLSAGEDSQASLAAWLPTPLPSLTGIRTGSMTADWVSSYKVTNLDQSSDYAVLLSASVTAHPVGHPATPLGVRCYQVLLTTTPGGGYGPTQPPAQTACPDTTPPPAASSTELAVTGDDGSVPDTVTRWLSAYLTGTGDIARYTTPGVSLPPVTPPAAVTLAVTALKLTAGDPPTNAAPADGTQVHVLATVTATHADVPAQLTYPLTLTARAGRWEVTALDLTAHPTPGQEQPR
jgi:hypothetical protein